MSVNEFNSQAVETNEVKPKKKKKKGLKIVLIILLVLIFGGLAGYGGHALYEEYYPYFSEGGNIRGFFSGKDNDVIENDILPEEEDAEPSEPVEVPEEVPAEKAPAVSEGLSASDIYAQNVVSTVGITTSITTNYWGYQTQSAASGSGFIVSCVNGKAYILTNYHVIEDSSSITVATYDGDEYEAALIGYDESNDIAVLSVDADDLSTVTLGDSDSLRVGDDVLAIGNPLGELTFSLSKGIVSALDREITMYNGARMNLIQTDCAINSGNSGGALFNMKGEVIGITNAKYSSSGSSTEASIDNIAFAIPINSVKQIVESLITNGYIVKPYIGVTVGTVSEESQNLGSPAGAYVQEITEGGPAEEAGIQQFDIIVSANGEAIASSNDLVDFIGKCAPGESVELGIFRNGEEVSVTIVIGEKQQAGIIEKEEAAPEYGYGFDGYGSDGYGYGGDNYGYGDFGSGSDLEDFFNFFFGNGGF